MNSIRIRLSRSMLLATGLVLALLAGVVIASVLVAGVAHAASCTSLKVIAARGSGEIYGDLNAGMGSTNYAAWLQIKKRIPDAQAYALPYEAVAIKPDSANVVTNRYWESISLGKVMLGRYVDQTIRECPGQRLAFLAYSQGVHVTADMLPLWGLDANIRSHIAGILLFGDPRFNPNSPIDRGSYSKTRMGVWPAFGVDSVRTVSSTWFSITRSYCDVQDFICNFSLANFRQCGEGSNCGHFAYVSSFTAASAGAWLGNTIRVLPPLIPPVQAPVQPANVVPTGGGTVTYLHHVYHTGGVGLKIRSAPNIGSTVVGSIPEGSVIRIICQTRGQRVTAETDVWDRISSGFVYDGFVDTQNIGRFSPPIPVC